MNRLEHSLASIVLRILGFVFDRLPIRRADRPRDGPGGPTGRQPRVPARGDPARPARRRARDAPRAVQLRPARQGRVPGAPRARHVPAAHLVPVRRGQRLPARSTSRPTGAARRWCRSGMRSGRSSGSARTRPAGSPSRSARSCTATTTTWSARARRRAGRMPRRCARRSSACCRWAWHARTSSSIPAAIAAARERMLAAYPALREGRVVLYAPTFRGRGRAKRASAGVRPPSPSAPACRRGHVLALKSHPNLDPGLVATAGFDVVIDPTLEINEVFAATDVLVTDYSSSIYEWALLRRPLVLLTQDLAEYERDPGLYLDAATELIGEHVDRPEDLPRRDRRCARGRRGLAGVRRATDRGVRRPCQRALRGALPAVMTAGLGGRAQASALLDRHVGLQRRAVPAGVHRLGRAASDPAGRPRDRRRRRRLDGRVAGPPAPVGRPEPAPGEDLHEAERWPGIRPQPGPGARDRRLGHLPGPR